MWEVFQDWKSIALVPLGESQVYCLEFADEPMLLVPVSEDSSGDLKQQSIAQLEDMKRLSLDSEQN